MKKLVSEFDEFNEKKFDINEKSLTEKSDFLILKEKILKFYVVHISKIIVPVKNNVTFKNICNYFTLRLQNYVGAALYKKFKTDVKFFDAKQKELNLDEEVSEDNEIYILSTFSINGNHENWYFPVPFEWGNAWELVTQPKLGDENSDAEQIFKVLFLLSEIREFDFKLKINVENTWEDALEEIKIFLIENGVNKIFLKKINFFDEYGKNLNYKLKNDGITTSNCCKKFKISFENMEPKNIAEFKICFKNINLAHQNYEKIKSYLKKWTSNNRFDVRELVNINQTWFDLLKLIKTDMGKNGINWEIIKDIAFKVTEGSIEKKIGMENYDLGKTDKTIQFIYLPYSKNWSEKITLFFKEIASSKYSFYKIDQYLKNSKSNPIDIEQNVGKYDTFSDLIWKLVQKTITSQARFSKGTDLRFELIDITFEDQILNHQWNEKDGTVSLKLQYYYSPYSRELSKPFEVYFKNVTNEVNYSKKIMNYLKSFTTTKRFDLKNNELDGDNTWNDMMNWIKFIMNDKERYPKKVIDNLEFDGDKESLSLKLSVNMKNGEISQNIKFRYLNHSKEWSSPILMNFKNVLEKGTFYNRIINFVKKFNCLGGSLNLFHRTSGEHTWENVIEIMKKQMTYDDIGFPNSVIAKIQFNKGKDGKYLKQTLLDCEEHDGSNSNWISFRYLPYSNQLSDQQLICVKNIYMDSKRLKAIKKCIESFPEKSCSYEKVHQLFYFIRN